jgi:hypothetical protein
MTPTAPCATPSLPPSKSKPVLSSSLVS